MALEPHTAPQRHDHNRARSGNRSAAPARSSGSPWCIHQPEGCPKIFRHSLHTRAGLADAGRVNLYSCVQAQQSHLAGHERLHADGERSWCRVQPSRVYQRQRPERTVAYQVVQRNLDTLLAWRRDGVPVADESSSIDPVLACGERKLRKYLECGVAANGFARARCEERAPEFLVAYSCKGHGVRIAAHGRAGRERLVRYCARPLFAGERLV